MLLLKYNCIQLEFELGLELFVLPSLKYNCIQLEFELDLELFVLPSILFIEPYYTNYWHICFQDVE